MKQKEKILELQNQKTINDFIMKHPGIHQRRIIKEINLSEGTIKYHLDFLIKNGFITKNKFMGYSRFYPSENIGRIEKEILSIFRQEIPRHILIYLICNFGVTISEISKIFEKDKKTIGYHFKKLIEMDLIEPAEFKDGLMLTNRNRHRTVFYKRKPIGKEKIYRLKQPYLIYYFFVKRKESFLDDGITKSALDYLALVANDRPPKYDRADKMNDRIIEKFYDIFPHPYHV